MKLLVSAFNFIKKETQTQVFSCEFWEIFNNTFFTENLRATASAQITKKYLVQILYVTLEWLKNVINALNILDPVFNFFMTEILMI